MRRVQSFVLLRVLGLMLLAAGTGCVGTTPLCESRLTAINVPVAAAEPFGSRGAHP
jgi:hypothetical protein